MSEELLFEGEEQPHLLLVDDDPTFTRVLARAMSRRGLRVSTAGSAEEGLALAQQDTPDYAVLDLKMEGDSGLVLLPKLLELHADMRVVILTGYDDFQYAHRAIKMQVYDYVLKPVTPASINELTDRLRGELDERRLRNIDDSMQIVASYFLNQLMTRRLDAKRIEESCRAHKLI